MRVEKKRTLAIAGGVVALIAIVALIAVLTFDINSYKSQIETTISQATGLNVKIGGSIGLSFFPFGVSAKDIHVAGRGREVLSLERLKLGAKLLPLLRKQLKVTSCALVRPAVTIVKDHEGKYNFESDKKGPMKGFLGAAFTLNDLKLFQGTVVYLDKKTGEKTEVREISLAIKDLTVADTSGEIVKNVSFTGNVDCKQLLRKDLKIETIKGFVRAKKGVFHLRPLTVYIFGAKGEGDVIADKSEMDAAYSINLNVRRLNFERLFESFGAKKVIGGKVDLIASLTVKEKGGRELLKGIYGTLSLRGNNLVTYTVDLDKILSAFAASQKFSLLDIGAFFIAGPLGSVALKGYRYGDLYYQTQGSRGTITKFVSLWKIRNGEADATDCALATRHNRVALKGKLNFVDERYDNVIVALLDDKGCAKFKQSISGSFSSPQAGAVDVVESLAAPFINLFRQARRFVQGGKCQVFYRGSVPQPR